MQSLKPPQNYLRGERLVLVSRIMETIPEEGATMAIDDPGLADELERRLSDGSEIILWSDLRAGR